MRRPAGRTDKRSLFTLGALPTRWPRRLALWLLASLSNTATAQPPVVLRPAENRPPASAIRAIPLAGLRVLGNAQLLADGRQVLASGWGGRLVLVALDAAMPRWEVRAHSGAVRALAEAAEGVLVSGGADGAVHTWSAADGRKLRTLRHRGAPVRALAARGTTLAVACDSPGVTLYTTDGRKLAVLGAGAGRARALAISPDGRLLVVGGEDGKLRIYELAARALVRTIEAHEQWINALAISPDGRLVASAAFDKRSRVFELQSGRRLHSFRGHSRRVSWLAFDPSGPRLASASLDRTVVLWDLSAGKLLGRYGQHRFQVGYVGFGPAGRFLISASTDGYLRVFPRSLAVPHTVALLSPPGKGELTLRCYTSGERLRIRVLDSAGALRPAALKQLAYLLRSGPDDLQYPPDGRLITFLYAVADHFGREREIVVISGFRSPRFNRLRTRQSKQVAKQSKHILGKAIDFKISGVPLLKLRRYLEKRRFGGVGYYPESQFVHLDSAKVRRWSGD